MTKKWNKTDKNINTMLRNTRLFVSWLNSINHFILNDNKNGVLKYLKFSIFITCFKYIILTKFNNNIFLFNVWENKKLPLNRTYISYLVIKIQEITL